MKLENIFSLTGSGTRDGHCGGPSCKGHGNRKQGQNQTSSGLSLSRFLQRRRGQQSVNQYHSSRSLHFLCGWTGYIWRLLSK